MAEGSATPVKRLTLKQHRFVDKYLENGGNATQAAKDAGYTGNQNVMRTIASRNLHNPYIDAAIQATIEAQAITPQMVIASLGRIAFADWKGFVKIKYSRTGEIVDATMDLTSVVRANELLGKYFKLWTDKVEVTTEEVVRVLEYVPPKQLSE